MICTNTDNYVNALLAIKKEKKKITVSQAQSK